MWSDIFFPHALTNHFPSIIQSRSIFDHEFNKDLFGECSKDICDKFNKDLFGEFQKDICEKFNKDLFGELQKDICDEFNKGIFNHKFDNSIFSITFYILALYVSKHLQQLHVDFNDNDFHSYFYNFAKHFLNEVSHEVLRNFGWKHCIMDKIYMSRHSVITLDCNFSDRRLTLVPGKRYGISEMVNTRRVRTPLHEFRDNDKTTITIATIPTSSVTPLGDTDDHINTDSVSEATPYKHPSEQLQPTSAHVHDQHSPPNLPWGHFLSNYGTFPLREHIHDNATTDITSNTTTTTTNTTFAHDTYVFMLIPTYNYNDTFDVTVFQIFDFVVHHMKHAFIKLFIPILFQQFVFETFFEHLVIKFASLRTGRLHHQVSDRLHIWFQIGFNSNVLVDTIFKINDFSSNIYYHNSKIYESSRVIHSEVFRKIYPTVAIYYDIHFLINFANLDVCFEGRFMDFDICLEIAFLIRFPSIKVCFKRQFYFVIGRIPGHIEALRHGLPDRRSGNYDVLVNTFELDLMFESFEKYFYNTFANYVHFAIAVKSYVFYFDVDFKNVHFFCQLNITIVICLPADFFQNVFDNKNKRSYDLQLIFNESLPMQPLYMDLLAIIIRTICISDVICAVLLRAGSLHFLLVLAQGCLGVSTLYLSTLYSLHSTLYSLLSTLYTLHSTLYSLLYLYIWPLPYGHFPPSYTHV